VLDLRLPQRQAEMVMVDHKQLAARTADRRDRPAADDFLHPLALAGAALEFSPLRNHRAHADHPLADVVR
jgi:hypothetical protein